ncbi:unnamed protein product [Rotaria sp. Silwood2]|nr:unnamed protein product [Rotaria sp. Silwood2]CAF4223399.1 unnamed protein product [Rotaria sp. Silwood2]
MKQQVIICFLLEFKISNVRKWNKNVSIIWSGDFNPNKISLELHLLSAGVLLTDKNNKQYNEDYDKIIEEFDYKTPIQLSTFLHYA